MKIDANQVELKFQSHSNEEGIDLQSPHASRPRISAEISTADPKSSNTYSNKTRKIMSRKDHRSLQVRMTLPPGQVTEGCLVCCQAPSCCPMLSLLFPCCGDSYYIIERRLASSYLLIRENSIEWNDPSVVMQPGVCFGIDPCLYDIQDQVKVIYFDDPMFERITDRTRTCNECRTCLFGGRGERIRLDAPVCCGCCQRGSFPCLCVPVCCPKTFCPCILRHEIYTEDAQKALFEIKKARSLALNDAFYYEKPAPSSTLVIER